MKKEMTVKEFLKLVSDTCWGKNCVDCPFANKIGICSLCQTMPVDWCDEGILKATQKAIEEQVKVITLAGAFKPRYGETYYFVQADGKVSERCWHDKYDTFDTVNYKIGNCYQTKEEAVANKQQMVSLLCHDSPLVL